LKDVGDLRGLLISSDHESFVLGGGVDEIYRHARLSADERGALLVEANEWLNRLQALSAPTVVAINGDAFGGGFELTLACDMRVMSETARVSLPYTRWGVIPGWGGCVRLARIVGLEHAIDWICTGREVGAGEALSTGLVANVIDSEHLREGALDLLIQCANGVFDVTPERQRKAQPLALSKLALTLAVESARERLSTLADRQNPAINAALETLAEQASMTAADASNVEAQCYSALMESNEARALTNLYRNKWRVKAIAAAEIKRAALNRIGVLGAGVMGRAIAERAALMRLRVVLMDVKDQKLEESLDEIATRLRTDPDFRQLSPEMRLNTLRRIRPTLSYREFSNVDLAIEAVIEDPGVKTAVLSALEQVMSEDAVLATNTSAIPISGLARSLKRPQQFCGIHFFNPVSKMPLVEVVRAAKTSDETIGRALGFAVAMGKTPVVVRDCPGFFVNRVLNSYVLGFLLLVRDGVDPYRIDRLMEDYGWRAGPARTLDALGIDTALNITRMLGAAYPDRLIFPGESVIERLRVLRQLGRKTGVGFYRYPEGFSGAAQFNPRLQEALEPMVERRADIADREVVERMMIPLKIEVARVLEEGIIGTPAAADVALVLGVGYPAFRGGACYALDSEGLGRFVARCRKYEEIGAIYQPGLQLREMATAGHTYAEWGASHDG
ncbi:MAG: fatty acid oxidation complex subunit alpha FadB, partial [Oceanospirillales bacterium]|nr:fatty acid oxidation complex subunit alpha FadB [Oceanospirillales bacterium]